MAFSAKTYPKALVIKLLPERTYSRELDADNLSLSTFPLVPYPRVPIFALLFLIPNLGHLSIIRLGQDKISHTIKSQHRSALKRINPSLTHLLLKLALIWYSRATLYCHNDIFVYFKERLLMNSQYYFRSVEELAQKFQMLLAKKDLGQSLSNSDIGFIEAATNFSKEELYGNIINASLEDNVLLKAINTVEDFRSPIRRHYPLNEILLSAIVAIICGATSWESSENQSFRLFQSFNISSDKMLHTTLSALNA